MTLSNRSIIANQKFIYKKEDDHLKGKLKYFQHRDDKNTHIQQRDETGEAIRRWEDRGLGDNYNKIAESCSQLATSGLKNDVGARTLVLSPQVEFMAAISPDKRMELMAELTDATVERWFEEMRLPPAEYAFVVHQGEVKTDRPEGIEQENKEFVHSHVILAATTPGRTQDRDNYKVYKEQLEQLHEASVAEMERIWTRELGQDRVQELNQELEELTEKLKQIDLENSQIIKPEQKRSPQERDEALLELYEVTERQAPADLLGRVYDARMEQAKTLDPVGELRELGFDIPEDDDMPQLSETSDLIDDLRELGFDIPEDDDMPQSSEMFDIIDDLRELGFDIPKDTDIDIETNKPDIGMDIE